MTKRHRERHIRECETKTECTVTHFKECTISATPRTWSREGLDRQKPIMRRKHTREREGEREI